VEKNNVIAIVPARAGSKRLPGKNLLRIGGIPLWKIAVRQALAAGIPKVVVTTNIQAILDLPHPPGVVYLRRPARLCGDRSRVEDAVLHVLERFPAEKAVVLNPTHPFRNIELIRLASTVICNDIPTAVAVFMDYHYTAREGCRLKSLNQAERSAKHLISGSIYAFLSRYLKRYNRMFSSNPMCILDPLSWVDIDTPMDYYIARCIYKKLGDHKQLYGF